MSQNFARAEMLIRKEIAVVFEAIVNPEITTRIWFTKSSGRLEAGREVEWEWEMYNHRVRVKVLELVPELYIKMDWGNYEQPSLVEWHFKTLKEGTFVSVVNTMEQADPEKLVAEVRDSTEGFTLVLGNLKALLEHDIILNLVADRFPAE
ncbi:SRPBCC domain-containing protein [Taibaiella chishuiensis]|uniref:Uncharacterized protein YndB with AHSA1/START domain n=1 Tax=Taibaiella chishuiensis TaxID=1434707 RepID=A0A2P8CR41_9BACT|nr:SRPBCC domain-containing protein [Taibaiella chishuiensis]PSK87431.1 uncharacterized protein YndB with AHSA1/START domain [Taibaiella chishuiensis]